MKTVSISVTDCTTTQSHHVKADFEDDEIELLENYLSNVDRLGEAKLIKDGCDSALTINYSDEAGLSCIVRLPPDDEIMAFLHRLRRLILNDERSSYNRITGLLGKKFDNALV